MHITCFRHLLEPPVHLIRLGLGLTDFGLYNMYNRYNDIILTVCVCLYTNIYLSIYLSIYLFMYPSIYLSIYLSIYPIYPTVSIYFAKARREFSPTLEPKVKTSGMK